MGLFKYEGGSVLSCCGESDKSSAEASSLGDPGDGVGVVGGGGDEREIGKGRGVEGRIGVEEQGSEGGRKVPTG